MEDFTTWLNGELEHRGWSRSEAARRGKFSASMLDKVISGYARPGLSFFQGISRAFNLPLEIVLRRAGLLPLASAVSGSDDKRSFDKLVTTVAALTPANQKLVFDLVEKISLSEEISR